MHLQLGFWCFESELRSFMTWLHPWLCATRWREDGDSDCSRICSVTICRSVRRFSEANEYQSDEGCLDSPHPNWSNELKIIVDGIPSFFCKVTSGISCWHFFLMDSIKLQYWIEAEQDPCMNKRFFAGRCVLPFRILQVLFLKKWHDQLLFQPSSHFHATLAEEIHDCFLIEKKDTRIRWWTNQSREKLLHKNKMAWALQITTTSS